MNILLIIMLFIIMLLIVSLIYLYKKYKHLVQEYSEYKKSKFKEQNILSMIEYHIKNYKEGKNIYTVFRDISDIIYNLERTKYNGKEEN